MPNNQGLLLTTLNDLIAEPFWRTLVVSKHFTRVTSGSLATALRCAEWGGARRQSSGAGA